MREFMSERIVFFQSLRMGVMLNRSIVSFSKTAASRSIMSGEGKFLQPSIMAIPASVTVICNTLYNGPTIMYEGAFSGSAWLNSQPDGLVYAGKVLYGYKGTMPANTTINNIRADTIAIAYGAFAECGNLTRITIPASVTSVGQQAFGFWQPSQTITIQGSTTGWDSRWNEYCYARIVYQGR